MKTDMIKFKETFLECTEAIRQMCRAEEIMINGMTRSILIGLLMYLELQGNDND